MVEFKIGETYSRRQICDALGGTVQSYLPDIDGKVVCGCFDPGDEMNPNAPEEILFGTAGPSPDINRTADLVYAQGHEGQAIPVFLKRRANEWEYVGDYLCIGITRDARVVARKMADNPARGAFHGVLRFEKV